MGHSVCCVVNCKNTGRNSSVKFYRFPVASYKLEQRKKWIAAVQKINPDGSSWFPKPSDLICSQHFIENKKSENQFSPSYIPTIFSSKHQLKKINEGNMINRHQRFMKRRIREQQATSEVHKQHNKATFHNLIPLEDNTAVIQAIKNEDKEISINQDCQIDLIPECNQSSKTLIGNTYSSFFVDVSNLEEIESTSTEINKSPQQLEVCRLCLVAETDLYSVIDLVYEESDHEVKMVNVIMDCTSVDMEDDNITQKVCKECLISVEHFYEFKKKCKKSDTYIRNLIKLREKEMMKKNKVKKYSSYIIKNNSIPEISINENIKTGNIQSNSADLEKLRPAKLSVKSNIRRGKTNGLSEKFSRPDICLNMNAQTNTVKSESIESNTEVLEKIHSTELSVKPNIMAGKTNMLSKDISIPDICLNTNPQKKVMKNKIEAIKKTHLGESSVETNKDLSISVTCLSEDAQNKNTITYTKNSNEPTLENINILNTPSEQKLNQSTVMPKIKSVMKKCPKCLRMFYNQGQHQKTCVNQLFFCELCNKSFTEISDFQNHISNDHSKTSTSKTFNCNICNEQFSNENNLKLHFKMHIIIQLYLNSESNELPCYICKNEFNTEEELKDHISTHSLSDNSTYQCQLCPSLRFKTDSLFKDHLKAEHGMSHLICSKCLTAYDDQNKFKDHLLSHEKLSPRDLSCPFCKSTFQQLTAFKSHLKSHSEEMYRCTVCANSFKNMSLLIAHNKMHLAKLCPICGEETTKDKLHTHTIGQLRFQCAFCNKLFTNKKRLQVHSCPMNESKKGLCSICGYVAPRFSDLNRHLAIHSDERPFKCKWPDCSKTFRKADKLSNHMAVHRNERKFKCHLCNLSFNLSFCLKQHLTRHTGVKPFSCQLCNKKFRLKRQLNGHKSRMHQVIELH